MKRNFVASAASLLVLAFVCLGCFSFTANYYTQEKKLAGKAIERFHRLYNEEKIGEIVEESHPDAKELFVKQGFAEKFGKWRADEGPVVSSKLIDDIGKPFEGKVSITVGMRTVFENGTATEEFVWVVNGNEALLYSYNVEPLNE